MYKTRLNLIEPTKLLERVTVDNLRFLNPIGHDYAGGGYFIEPTEKPYAYLFADYLGDREVTGSSSRTDIENRVYKNLYGKNSELNIYELCFWENRSTDRFAPVDTYIKVTSPDNRTWTWTTRATSDKVIGTVPLETIGDYKIEYSAKIGDDTTDTATYTTTVLDNTVAKKPRSITEVIERILNAGVGAWNGYYKLDPVLAAKWSKIQAPEFEITGKTLFEALLMVGGYKDIQAIPRLGPTPGSEKTGEDWKYNFITFDELNGNSEWKPPVPYLSRQVVWGGESYCGGLESYVDNFVDNSANGAARFPFPKTVRTESSDLIIDDNYAIIKTAFPIYKVNKVTQARINSYGGDVGDITPYIFEKSEYDNLTKYKGDFPSAKQYAFYYVQGQPNLYGLVLKPETATSLDAAVQEFAAVQIAERKSGQKYFGGGGIAAFAYTVEYTPMTSRRIRQFRPTGGYPNGNLLYYNQSANIVDSKNYGGRMKSELARIGNQVVIETYRLYKLSDVPKPGQTKDGMYISEVDWEIQTTSIKVTVYLVKNYNRLSEYVGINSMQRFYEVSEKQATNRMCNFSYISTIGDATQYPFGAYVLTEDGANAFAKVFQNIPEEQVGDDEIAFVVATAYSKDGNQIQSSTIHEVISNGFGNSLCFYFSFEDNYSAGSQALYQASARKIQRAVPYGDAYGEFYSLKMDFYKYNTQRDKGGFTYVDQISDASTQGWCDRLPAIGSDDFSKAKPYMSYTATIDKNSGEKISVETQIHFQTNDPSVFIGSALSEDNPLVANEKHTHTFVCLPYEIKPLQETIAVEDIDTYKVDTPEVTVSGYAYSQIAVGSVKNTTGNAAKSWACVNEIGNILIGKNEKIAINEFGSGTTIFFNLSIK